MYHIGVLPLVLACALCLSDGAGARTADPVTSVGGTVDTVLEREAYQRDLPRLAETPRDPSRDTDIATPDWKNRSLAGNLSLSRLVMWTVLVFALGFIALALYREVASRRSGPRRGASVRREAHVPDLPARTAVRRKTALDEVDALAARGAYDKAVRLLLELCIGKVQAQFSPATLPSMTNREILREAELPEPARKSFSTIVTAEELAHYGGRGTDLNVFQVCRDCYLTLERALTGAGVGR